MDFTGRNFANLKEKQERKHFLLTKVNVRFALPLARSRQRGSTIPFVYFVEKPESVCYKTRKAGSDYASSLSLLFIHRHSNRTRLTAEALRKRQAPTAQSEADLLTDVG